MSGIVFALLVIATAGCGQIEVPPAVVEAQSQFAEAKDVPVTEVEIVEREQVTWDDTCLELGPLTPGDEVCEDEETAGYRIVFEVNDEQTTVRTDSAGTLVLWPGLPEIAGADITQDVEVFVSLDGMPGVTASQELMPYEQEEGMWEVTPQHLRVNLDGYPVTETAFEPHLRVYEVDEVEAARGNIEQILLEYQQILAAMPEVQGDWDTLIFVPLIEANQQFYAKPKRVDFEDGTGYRFLTQYGGEDEPVTNDTLFYAYQGITEDDNFLVTAFLPVSHPDLGEGATTEMVSEADPSSFTPDLEVLDGIVQSIVLNQSPSE
jgi:hypothetical protein